MLAREGSLPETLKGFNQAFRSAGRSQDLVRHSNESQSSAPDKAKTRFLGVMLSTVIIKSLLQRYEPELPATAGKGEKNKTKKTIAIRGSKCMRRGCSPSPGGSHGQELRGLGGRPTRWRHRPCPHGLRLAVAHYLLGCRYWCVNMLSSLSNQPALFLQRNGYFVALRADHR